METGQENLTKKERADLRRAEKEKAQHKTRSARKMKKYFSWGIAIAIVGALIFWGISSAEKADEARPGEHQANEGSAHIDVGDEHDEYETNPPTSGSHAESIPFGIYDTEVVDENAIHNMEHGGIWITYKDLSDEDLAKLEEIARKAPRSVLLSPRSANDSRISVASWQRLMHLEEVDVEAIEDYISKNINRSPEPLAS